MGFFSTPNKYRAKGALKISAGVGVYVATIVNLISQPPAITAIDALIKYVPYFSAIWISSDLIEGGIQNLCTGSFIAEFDQSQHSKIDKLYQNHLNRKFSVKYDNGKIVD